MRVDYIFKAISRKMITLTVNSKNSQGTIMNISFLLVLFTLSNVSGQISQLSTVDEICEQSLSMCSRRYFSEEMANLSLSETLRQMTSIGKGIGLALNDKSCQEPKFKRIVYGFCSTAQRLAQCLEQVPTGSHGNCRQWFVAKAPVHHSAKLCYAGCRFGCVRCSSNHSS